MATTTIKVPSALRDRLTANARLHGQSVAARLDDLLSAAEREARFESIRLAYQQVGADDDYWVETRAWDALSADGLDDA
ncbi:MAG: toxin-antitoxin system protein [Candidatus Nanopelagicales bacterium]